MDRRSFIRNSSVLAAALALIPTAVQEWQPSEPIKQVAEGTLTEHEFFEWLEEAFYKQNGNSKTKIIHCGPEMKQWFIDQGVPESNFRLVTDGVGCFWEAKAG